MQSIFEAFLWLEKCTAHWKSNNEDTCIWHFPPDVSMFLDECKDLHSLCFPDRESQSLHSPVLVRKDLHVFTLPDAGGNKKYGLCLRSFCNGEGKRYDVKRRRKCCLCIITKYPFFTLFHKLLLQVHAMCLLDNDTVSAGKLLDVLHTRSFTQKHVVEMNSFRIPHNLQFVIPETGRKSCPDVPILPLLEALGAHKFLFLLSCILCERRVLFVAENVSILSANVLAAVTMLHPFRWQVL